MMRLFLILFLISTIFCCTSYRFKETKQPKSLLRENSKITNSINEDFNNSQRYHSAYKTNNNYYDARNLILDNDIDSALDLLNENLDTLEYPHRAALWIFICYCKKSLRDQADDFLKQYVIPLSIDPEDKSSISIILKYYLGIINDDEVLSSMKRWDDLDNCAAYYYFGAYKKYYEGDYVTGNEFISKSLRTNISEYSEFKFSEVEVKGFTARNPGQYVDFPIIEPDAGEVGFELPMLAGFAEEQLENLDSAGIQGILDAADQMGFNTVLGNSPQGLTDEQYAVPSLMDDNWEVYNKDEVMELLQEEALSMVYNRMGDDESFMINKDLPLVLYPESSSIDTFIMTYEEYLTDIETNEIEYGLDSPLVTVNLSEGDFITGSVIHCQVFNMLLDQYEDDMKVVLNLLFAVQEDRRVELRQQFFRMLPAD